MEYSFNDDGFDLGTNFTHDFKKVKKCFKNWLAQKVETAIFAAR
ncbi:hypothetical protein [Lacibacter luteus]|nr:hypothetical protein [Lacibacter luteus]